MNTKEKQIDALELFAGNLNCAQSVLSAFAEELGFERFYLEKAAAAFGGGMGEGETCGAVSGALMVLGLKFGNSNDTPETKDLMKEITEEFKLEFLNRNDSLKCRDLIAYNLKNSEAAESALEVGIFQTRCPQFIKDAIGILDEIIIGKTQV